MVFWREISTSAIRVIQVLVLHMSHRINDRAIVDQMHVIGRAGRRQGNAFCAKGHIVSPVSHFL